MNARSHLEVILRLYWKNSLFPKNLHIHPRESKKMIYLRIVHSRENLPGSAARLFKVADCTLHRRGNCLFSIPSLPGGFYSIKGHLEFDGTIRESSKQVDKLRLSAEEGSHMSHLHYDIGCLTGH
jgi:hypothetical protein